VGLLEQCYQGICLSLHPTGVGNEPLWEGREREGREGGREGGREKGREGEREREEGEGRVRRKGEDGGREGEEGGGGRREGVKLTCAQ